MKTNYEFINWTEEMLNAPLTTEEKDYIVKGIAEDDKMGGKITCLYPEKETYDVLKSYMHGANKNVNLRVLHKLALYWKHYFENGRTYADAYKQAEYEYETSKRFAQEAAVKEDLLKEFMNV